MRLVLSILGAVLAVQIAFFSGRYDGHHSGYVAGWDDGYGRGAGDGRSVADTAHASHDKLLIAAGLCTYSKLVCK